MAAFNKVILMGRLTDAPEGPRSLPNSGTAVTKFRMAVGRSKKNPQTGQWENDPNTLYIDCEAFDYADSKRKIGNVISQYVKKGDQVFIEGRLQLDQWDDKTSGQKRSKHKVIVESVELLGGSKQENGHTAYGPPAAANGQQRAVNSEPGDDGGEIPF